MQGAGTYMLSLSDEDGNESNQDKFIDDAVEEDVISARTVMVVDSLLTRKGKISRKR